MGESRLKMFFDLEYSSVRTADVQQTAWPHIPVFRDVTGGDTALEILCTLLHAWVRVRQNLLVLPLRKVSTAALTTGSTF
jgi:hypothetical protein